MCACCNPAIKVLIKKKSIQKIIWKNFLPVSEPRREKRTFECVPNEDSNQSVQPTAQSDQFSFIQVADLNCHWPHAVFGQTGLSKQYRSI